ncbi:unnamed protein product [Effrenium voratum]|uniref:PARP catalytic domain-containing protein n=1 Tax=Effrenium voratum TaxID=2562239 RepID=A0AA36JRI2_9DINO|nr:unnamed protein product [Effrenium voratum]CAJ1410382.1 unnamed protein product [Effrenium voratum]CAJ1441113.1 unnamed protein product [Effrenium voratum]
MQRAAFVVLLAVACCEQLQVPEECADQSLELRQLRVQRRSTEINETGPEEAPELDGAENFTMSPEDSLAIFMAAQPEYNETPELRSQSHHSSHHGRHVKTLYHQTSKHAGPIILKHGFRRGRVGWCGGGIYFALSPGATYGKAVGVDSHQGFMIEAKVDVGHVKYEKPWCTSSRRCWGIALQQAIRCIDSSYQGGRFAGQGYDSLYFNPGDGGEYMIWDSSRVISMRRV